MIGLIQRVSMARVAIGERITAQINAGLLVFVAVEKGDEEAQADRLLNRVLSYRVFADHTGKMNLSLLDTGGGLLIVPQVTLAADTRKGARPSLAPAAPPQAGKRLFDYFVRQACGRYSTVGYGCFGADMQVTLTNDGPVTLQLRVLPAS